MLIDRVVVGPMFTNSYIVSTSKKECLIIDPGADTQTLIDRLEAMNLVPTAIVFTHGHIDHTSAALHIVEHYAQRGKEVRVGVHEGDSRYLGDHGHRENAELFGHFGAAGTSAFEQYASDPIPEADFHIHDEQVIPGTDLLVLHTPGHSDGSVCLYSEGRQALFSGDTLFFNTIGRSDFPSGNGSGVTEAVSKRLFGLPAETRVFPGHGPITSIEREIAHNPLSSDGATI